jgi:hypothetical protein
LTIYSLFNFLFLPKALLALKSTVCEIYIAALTIILLVLALYIFHHSFTFNVHVYCRQYIDGSWSTLDNLCVLVDTVRPLSLKVIVDISINIILMDINGLISITFATIFYLWHWFFVPIFVFHSFSAFCDLIWHFYIIQFSLFIAY